MFNKKDILLSPAEVSRALTLNVEEIQHLMKRAGCLYAPLCTAALYVGMYTSGVFVYEVICTHDIDDLETYQIQIQYKKDYITEKLSLAMIN